MLQDSRGDNLPPKDKSRYRDGRNADRTAAVLAPLRRMSSASVVLPLHSTCIHIQTTATLLGRDRTEHPLLLRTRFRKVTSLPESHLPTTTQRNIVPPVGVPCSG